MKPKRNNRKSIKTIDMFCGAGGSSYGANKAGAQIVAGFDIWEPAQSVFKTNFKKSKIFGGDIRDVKPRNIKREIGDIDLILASPECTNHSIAKGAKERCELSKLTAFEVTRFARVFRPQWIVIENVVQMGSWSEHPKLMQELWDLNYFVKEVRLNAKNFGVPQSRNRLYLLCSRSKETNIPEQNSNIINNASEIIDWSDKYNFTPLFTEKRAEATLERAERAKKEVGNKSPFLLVYYGTDKGGGWQSLDRPLRTITTLDRFALVKPSNNGHIMRMLQPEELKLAMGFGNDFNLNSNTNVTRRNKIKLMGNGVCPPVMENIIKSITS